MKKFVVILIVAISLFFATTALADGTLVPGHDKDRWDLNENGYPDVGVTTVGKYTSVYAYDGYNDWYWDLGDGRILGSVTSIDQLDSATLTVCNYQVQYRGNFEDNPYLDSGWIINNINCSGYDDNGNYNYLIVHQTDPRYSGNPDWAVWGTWEYQVLVESGSGNLARPETPVGSK